MLTCTLPILLCLQSRGIYVLDPEHVITTARSATAPAMHAQSSCYDQYLPPKSASTEPSCSRGPPNEQPLLRKTARPRSSPSRPKTMSWPSAAKPPRSRPPSSLLQPARGLARLLRLQRMHNAWLSWCEQQLLVLWCSLLVVQWCRGVGVLASPALAVSGLPYGV